MEQDPFKAKCVLMSLLDCNYFMKPLSVDEFPKQQSNDTHWFRLLRRAHGVDRVANITSPRCVHQRSVLLRPRCVVSAASELRRVRTRHRKHSVWGGGLVFPVCSPFTLLAPCCHDLWWDSRCHADRLLSPMSAVVTPASLRCGALSAVIIMKEWAADRIPCFLA